jgi:hypothetical protein
MRYAPYRRADHPRRAILQNRVYAVGRARILAASFVLLAGLGAWGDARAQGAPQPKSLGIFDAWSAWEHGDQAARVCYLSATPASSQTKPPGVRRGEIRVTVSHRPGSNARDEISFQAGYPIKTDRAVGAVVDKTRNFEFSRRSPAAPEMIWSKDAAADKAMVAAMRGGRELVFNGTSQRGTTTADVFKLDGFAKALDAANKACGLR